MSPAIERLRDLPLDQLGPLIDESVSQGLRFLRRLADEWTAGTNRFARSGEALLAARMAGRLIGICGLNVDPYACDARSGRVRHLYVAGAMRRRGVGRGLIGEIITLARPSFDRLRLRTDDAGAAAFYAALGFQQVADVEAATHVLELRPRAPASPVGQRGPGRGAAAHRS